MAGAIESFKGEYAFLSNFHYAPMGAMGLIWPYLENAYQAAKLDPSIPNLNEMRIQFRDCQYPGLAKNLGRRITKRSDWENIKVPVMRSLLKIKFKDPTLRQKLLTTGDRELIEGNWWRDTFWGVCNGVGENHLGKLLMEIRSDLAQPR